MSLKPADTTISQSPKCMIQLNPPDLACIALAHEILSHDPTPKIRIEDLSIQIGINRNKLHYGFKQVYGLTIYNYIEQQRMQKAQLLLSTTHKSIKVITSLTGYCTCSRFGVVFKKNFGVTPRVFRKQIKLGAASSNKSV
jgi:AraC-like DNA-binding protein